jgi:SAM-dependent methyltransferase
MPVFRNRVAFQLANNLKAFLSLEAGLVRGEVLDSEKTAGQAPERAQNGTNKNNRQIKQMRQQLADKDQDAKLLRQRLANKDRELAELRNQIEGGPPIPPLEEIRLVTGAEDTSWFLKSGEIHTRIIREMLEKNGLDIEKFDSILDFGCGCGRLIRHWNTLERPAVHGSDYNPQLISWCKENLDFARFQLNDLVGRLRYENEKFDLIYAFSVFTHLTEPQHFHWIEELSRVLLPGGHLIITTHGERFLENLSPDDKERYRNGQLVVRHEEAAGSNRCAAFHPEPYVREKLARDLILVDYRPGTKECSQDMYLLKKP